MEQEKPANGFKAWTEYLKQFLYAYKYNMFAFVGRLASADGYIIYHPINYARAYIAAGHMIYAA